MLHGDLTPSNVLLTSSTKDGRRWQAKVGDWVGCIAAWTRVQGQGQAAAAVWSAGVAAGAALRYLPCAAPLCALLSSCLGCGFCLTSCTLPPTSLSHSSAHLASMQVNDFGLSAVMGGADAVRRSCRLGTGACCPSCLAPFRSPPHLLQQRPPCCLPIAQRCPAFTSPH